ncbi:hypothetical protein [Streptomyces sp. NBC_00105]|uniref:hypothetical protein n=1 Tax=Streptomyces sp. NBC_00105 TaxID=2903622 RepID=UPI003249D61B
MTDPTPPPLPPPLPAVAQRPSRRGLYVLIGGLGTLTLGAAVAIAAIVADDPAPAPAPAAPASTTPTPALPAPAVPQPATPPNVYRTPEQVAAAFRNWSVEHCTPDEVGRLAHVVAITDTPGGSTVRTDYPTAYDGTSKPPGQRIAECMKKITATAMPTAHGMFTVTTADGSYMWGATY